MKKILVIFLLCLFSSYVIYKTADVKTTNIIILGDNSLLNESDNYLLLLENKHKDVNINKLFTSKNDDYKKVTNNIIENKSIIEKEKTVYLTASISSSNIIVINLNNEDFIKKCNKSLTTIKNYIDIKYNDLNYMLELINKLSNAQIVFIGNYCTKYDKKISEYLEKKYDNYYYINIYKMINKYPNFISYDKTTLTKEAHLYIYNELKKVLN